MKRVLALAIAAGALVLAPTAQAKPDHGPDKGHWEDKGHGDGPPGLAKKPYGLPPGQAKKMWRRGEVLPTAYWSQPRYFIAPQTYHLRAPPVGYRWVLIDGDAYLVRTQSGLIADLVVGLLR